MSNLGPKQILEAAVADLKAFADEVDSRGTMTGEDQAGLTQRMKAVSDAKAALEADAAIKGSIADAKAFMAALGGGTAEQVASSKQGVGSLVTGGAKTFGEMFTESGAYTEFVKRFASNGRIPNDVKGIQSGVFNADSKALITGASSTSAGAFVRNDLYANDLGFEGDFGVLDVITHGTTESDTVDYVQIGASTNAAAPVAEATSAAAPTSPGSAGPLVPAAGGGYKPESSLALVSVSAAVKTIAHWIPVTKRAIADAGQIRTLIDAFLKVGLLEELEDQIVAGDGVGENFLGILNTFGVQTVGSAGTDIDAIVDAIRAIRVSGGRRIRRRPNALVIHPNDWYSTGFLLAKDTAGKYLIADPGAAIDKLVALWNLKVVVSEAVTENTALVGDFRKAVLWEREGVSVMVSDQHADFFVRNLLAILAEMRAAFGVIDPAAFCKVTAV